MHQSSLVLRFVNNDFQENKEPTIGGMSHPSNTHKQTYRMAPESYKLYE